MIERWIIGDAESYTRMENNFQDWLEEYRALISTLVELSRPDFKSPVYGMNYRYPELMWAHLECDLQYNRSQT